MTTAPGAISTVPALLLDEPRGKRQEMHIPELDGIRGLAALAVVLYHIDQIAATYSTGLLHRLQDLSLLGFLGVDVFFALSGFLITGVLLKRKPEEHYYKNFYARRLLRLVPPYLLTILLVALALPKVWPFLLLSLVYAANLSTLFHVPLGYGPLWSLSVEEHFYLLWPWVVRKNPRKAIAWIAMAICLLTPLARLWAIKHGGLNEYLSWYRFDGLAWGALVALVVSSPDSKRQWFRLFIPMLVIVGVALAAAGLYEFAKGVRDLSFSFMFSAVSMLTSALIGIVSQRRLKLALPLRSKVLRFFGDISYWLYLIHYLIRDECWSLLEKHAPQLIARGGFILWLTLTVAVLVPAIASGVVVRYWIELPMLRLKSKF